MKRKELEKRFESAEKQLIGLQDEFQNLKTKLAEKHDESEIPDFPVFKIDGESSWHVNNLLEVSSKEEAYGKVHDYNFFHTVDYAEEFADKCKLIAMMLHCKWYLDRDYVPDWDNCDDKFTVWYNQFDNEWTIDFQEIHEVPSIYFSTEEKAQKCADWLNKHWSGCDD
jgi:hypothetical protein